MNLSILVKNNENKSREEILEEGRKEFLKLFDIEPNFWERLRSGKRKSELLTKEQIAQVFLDNSLVQNLEEGLNEVEEIITKGGYYYSILVESKKVGGELKYQIRHYNTKFNESYARTILD